MKRDIMKTKTIYTNQKIIRIIKTIQLTNSDTPIRSKVFWLKEALNSKGAERQNCINQYHKI